MAQRQKPILGLDIDQVGITAASVRDEDGRPAVVQDARIALEPGVVRDGEVADVEALSEGLRALFAERKDLDRRVRVGIANQKIVVRTIELPPIEDPKELAAAVRFQAQDAIPMPLDQAVLDHQILDVVDTEQGPRQRVLIAAARRDMIDRVVAAVRGAGLRLEGIDLAAFAMIRALAPEAQPDEVILYADVAGSTNVAVARGRQCLFTRASGAGVEGLAIELAERRGLTLDHARAWLEHVGCERPVEEIDGDPAIVAETRRVLAEGVRRIGGEIRQSLDFHHMQAEGAPVGRAVLTGAATGIPGFTEAIGAELGIAAGAGFVLAAAEGARPSDLTVAAGLAASGVPGVNLLPAEERRAAAAGGRSGGAVYALLGAMALLLVLVAAYTLTSNSITSKEDDLARVTQEADQAEAQARQLAAYTDFAALREKRLETVRSIAASRFDWAHALGEVARTVPANVWLVSLDGSVTPADGGTGLRAALPVPAVQVVGCTTSQSNVARMMSDMRRIDGVTRVSLESSEKSDEGGGGGGGQNEGGSAGNVSDCRNGSDRFPQFNVTVFFAPPAASSASGSAPAPAPAPAAQGAPSGAAGSAASSPAPAPSGAAGQAEGAAAEGAPATASSNGGDS